MRLLVLAPAVFGVQQYCRLSTVGRDVKCTFIDREYLKCPGFVNEDDCDDLKSKLKELSVRSVGDEAEQTMGPERCTFTLLKRDMRVFGKINWAARREGGFAMDCTPITTA